MIGERVRWLIAAFGLVLWFWLFIVLPTHALEAGSAAWRASCAEREVPVGVDPCFSDQLPLVEVFGLPILVLAIGYPFAVLAFSLFAPVPERRSFAWRLAHGNDSGAGAPARVVIAACLLILLLWCWSALPLRRDLVPLHVYWAILAMWFLAGMAVRLHDHRELRRDAEQS